MGIIRLAIIAVGAALIVFGIFHNVDHKVDQPGTHLTEITTESIPHEVYDAGKPVGLLVVGTQNCNNCDRVDGLLSAAAARHPSEKFVKVVNDRVTTAQFYAYAPGDRQAVFVAEAFDPSATDIDNFLDSFDKLGDLYIQRAKAMQPIDADKAALEQDVAAFAKPYQDRIDQVNQQLEADPAYQKAKSENAKKSMTKAAAHYQKMIRAIEKERDAALRSAKINFQKRQDQIKVDAVKATGPIDKQILSTLDAMKKIADHKAT